MLISDGVSTEGECSGVLDEIKAKGVEVDTLTVDYAYENEVLIERLELPRSVRVGDTYEVAGIVRAENDGTGMLSLEENGKVIWEKKVEYHYGKNRFEIPIYMHSAGYYTYKLDIQPDEGMDSIEANNKAISYLYLEGEGRVLMVVQPGGDERDYLPMAKAMQEADCQVTVMEGYGISDDPMAYQMYDCIVFANVGAEVLSSAQMSAVRESVERLGLGFVMVGGMHSYGPGGYNKTDIEKILPVKMDVTQRKVLPKAALAIVLHTCEFPKGNTWAKEITKAAIRVLSAQDEVGVLFYDYQGGEQWLFDLTPASNYPMLVRQINGANPGDMPFFDQTMKMGYKSLVKSDASMKHMIIISDGDPQAPLPSLLNAFYKQKISVTTVAVFPHGNTVQTMKTIAKATGGRFYFPNNANLLPEIFIKEAKTLRKSMIQNKTFVPQMVFPSSVMKGINALPQLHGYVITQAKGRANTVLEVTGSEDKDPVLAEWQIGLGKTAAFTSDLSTNWGKDWVSWDNYKAFVHQLVNSVARVKEESNLRMQLIADGGKGLILVEDFDPEGGFLEVVANVRRPDRKEELVTLKQVGPRRYEGNFDVRGEGRYEVSILGQGDDREEKSHGGLMVAYSQEYLRLRSNPIVMKEIAKRTGGEVLSGDEKAEDIFEEEREAKAKSTPAFDWFLIILACLIPLDVGLRRVQIDWVMLGEMIGFKKRHEVSEGTYEKLKARKVDVDKKLKVNKKLEKARAEQKEIKPEEAESKLGLEEVAVAVTEVEADTKDGVSALAEKRRELRNQQEHEG